MSEKEKTVRVVLRVVQDSDGNWVFKLCKDQWQTMPFKYASYAAANADMVMVVGILLKRGYQVVEPTSEEVKTS